MEFWNNLLDDFVILDCNVHSRTIRWFIIMIDSPCCSYRCSHSEAKDTFLVFEELTSKLFWGVGASQGCQDAVDVLMLFALFSSLPSTTCWAQGNRYIYMKLICTWQATYPVIIANYLKVNKSLESLSQKMLLCKVMLPSHPFSFYTGCHWYLLLLKILKMLFSWSHRQQNIFRFKLIYLLFL